MRHTLLSAFSALSMVSVAYGNFHVGRTTLRINGVYAGHRACPSSQYGCSCFKAGSNVKLSGGRQELETYFQIQPGFCGMGWLDFYKSSDGSWDLYVNNGDGQVQGKCWSNSAYVACPLGSMPINSTLEYNDKLVCYSSICGN